MQEKLLIFGAILLGILFILALIQILSMPYTEEDEYNDETNGYVHTLSKIGELYRENEILKNENRKLKDRVDEVTRILDNEHLKNFRDFK